MRVLVVDPDSRTSGVLVGRLSRNGHEVVRVDSGRAALRVWRQADLVLLDLELPDLDGIEVCRSIRAEGNTAVITFTTEDREMDRVLSLQAGADDCMLKSYGYRELSARMNAVMRRATARTTAHAVFRGSLRIDPRSRQVRLEHRVVAVTRKEFDLLLLLASHPETTVTRRELMSTVWADDWTSSSRTVDTHVNSLRNKLGAGDWIVTVRSVGYRIGSCTVG
ncbi:response regulator transcription factor [Streptacidiphilus sp. PAMC 29251]